MVNETRLSGREVCRFLTLWAPQEIDRQAIVHVSDSRCLRPAVWSVRREGHDPMLSKSSRILDFRVSSISVPLSRKPDHSLSDARSTALMQVNTGTVTHGPRS
jgi:hypothetical protein